MYIKYLHSRSYRVSFFLKVVALFIWTFMELALILHKLAVVTSCNIEDIITKAIIRNQIQEKQLLFFIFFKVSSCYFHRCYVNKIFLSSHFSPSFLCDPPFWDCDWFSALISILYKIFIKLSVLAHKWTKRVSRLCERPFRKYKRTSLSRIKISKDINVFLSCL